MKQDKLAYTAGLLDGEGCISIKKAKPSLKRRTVNSTYNLDCTIAMSYLPVLLWLKDTFNGNVRLVKASKSQYGLKPIWHWRITDRQACDFLKLVYPYLKVKKEEAKLGISFQEFKSRSSKGWGQQIKPQYEVKVLEEAYQTLRQAKREV